jgi:hypothetical protein
MLYYAIQNKMLLFSNKEREREREREREKETDRQTDRQRESSNPAHDEEC